MSDSPATRRCCAARIGASLILGIAVDGIVCPQRAYGVTRTWNGGISGSWSVPSNWNPLGVPGTNDDVIIPSQSGTADTNVTYDYTGPALAIDSLTLNRVGTGLHSSILNMSADNLGAFYEYLGDSTGSVSGRGQINQSGGTNSTTLLELGVSSIDLGNYSLSGTGFLQSGNGISVGVNGAGSFMQGGGTANLGGLFVGAFSGSRGTYTLNAGSLTLSSGVENIGYQGTGTFTQTGGSHSVSYAGFAIGQTAVSLGVGGSGTFNLSGGSLTITDGVELVGNGGAGTFIQSGGTHSISFDSGGGAMTIGNLAGSLGTYSLSNTGALVVTHGSEFIGNAGTGVFDQTGGTNSINFGTGTLSGVALGLKSTGTYNLRGSGILTVVGRVSVGGLFNQTGGSSSITFDNLGSDLGALEVDSTYVISGGSVAINGRVIVGGVVNQSGGAVIQPAGDLFLVPTGTYDLSAGSLTAINLVVGAGGTLAVGNFLQTGGSNSTAFLTIGSSGGSGTYNLSAGTLSITGNGISVGAGSSTFGSFIQTGGLNQILDSTAALHVARFSSATGTYALSGTGVVTVAGSEFVGELGNGTFTQNGGANTITGAAGFLSIATSAGATGAYLLNGGALSVPNLYVGGGNASGGGAGSLVVAAGATLTVSGTLKAWNVGSVTIASPMRVGAVATAGNGKIDLTNSAMVVDYAPGPSPIAAVRALLVSGYASGAWNGPGINSSTAAVPANLNKSGVGYAEAADLFSSFPANFAGLSADSSSVLLRYTLYGDANLDGTVDTLDFNALAGHFGATGERWSHGDFNYDGVIDTLDFNSLSANFGQSLPTEAANSPASLVPEPAWLGVAACALTIRRRSAHALKL